MIDLRLSSREIVGLYLTLEKEHTANPELSGLRERISRKLCNYLSIEQFEMLESLYARGYEFEEVKQ